MQRKGPNTRPQEATARRSIAASRAVRVAIDIGGTFTDIVVMDGAGVLHEGKVSTTPVDLGSAVIRGVEALLRDLAIRPGAVAEILHGTTIASNTILQKSGAATGLITTRGFRDVLEIGRIRMPEMFDLTWSKPPPLVPRRYRLEVTERIDANGGIVEVLNEAELLAGLAQLHGAGIGAIAICFINSYRNPIHEQRAEALIRSAYPEILVTSSYSVQPEMKEYERTSTTVVNAYLLSVMRDYLQQLETGLRTIGIEAPVLVMTSNGGMIPAAVASEKPVFVVASGPAGAVIGGSRLAQARGEADAIVFDMGGTTAKAVMIEAGQPSMTSEYEFREGISTSSRFIKAGGYMLNVPAIDIAEVGAGGGSIAAIDQGGLLHAGPASAGAVPGPACYGLGNERPTVTDANVVLGYINPTALAGGQLPISRDLSLRAIEKYIANPLGMSAEEAAHGIRAVANAAMSRAIRAVSVERGRDPRDFTLIALGGNGGIHASELAIALGIRRVVVPPFSGVFSAVGMLGADVEHVRLTTLLRPLDDFQFPDLKTHIDELETEIRSRLERDGYVGDDVALVWQADLRHEGQASELTVGFDPDMRAPRQMAESFLSEYLKTYGYCDETPIELVRLRLIGRGLRALRLDFGAMRAASRPAAAPSRSRPVSFGRGEDFVATPIICRSELNAKCRSGPLIIDEFDATIVVPPNAVASRDALGCVLIELEGVS